MRNIQYIAVHCTATQPSATVESIKKYWKEVKGWETVGYHFLIEANGNVNELLPIKDISNGVQGFNSCSINVCYIGGIDEKGNPKDTRTPEQKQSLINVLRKLKTEFPKAIIQGHYQFPNVAKACPSFNAKKEYEYIK